MFRNIYFSDQPFRDHNWNDFFENDLRKDKESYIENQLRGAYEDKSGPEPYFENILPLTLKPESCQSFLKNTNLPIAPRDYYLSKLFQFLFVPLRLRFTVEADTAEVRQRLEGIQKRLEEFLDGIPLPSMESLSEFDWYQFFDDTFCYELDDVLGRLPLCLPDPKSVPSSDKMTRERWLEEGWPARLKRWRGTDPQKMAADRIGVSFETYKKWEQGKRPPLPKYMPLVRQLTGELESKT